MTTGSVVVERLVDRTECGTDVFQFVVDVQGDFRQTDDQAQHSDGRDQNQLSRNDETSFVVDQGSEERRHGGGTFLRYWKRRISWRATRPAVRLAWCCLLLCFAG